VSAATRVAAVVGAPVRASLSPLIHNAWIAAAGIDAVYVALEARADTFADLVRGLRGGGVAGLNITAPFKSAALAAADTASARARGAGAANLLLFGPDGAVAADNTDGEGLLAALAEQAPAWRADLAPVLILGAGGAARGAARALIDAGARRVTVFNRTPGRALALAAELDARAVAEGGLEDAVAKAGLIVNCASAAPPIPLAAAPSSAVVMDLVYRPLATPLLLAARARGLATVDGLAMLIGQARPSFAALFGTEAPAVDVRALALEALA
jgi:shikimate dehydrogenase